MGEDFRQYLSSEQQRIENSLKEFLDDGIIPESTIYRAMHYSIFAGGKRFRPILLLAGGRAAGAPQEHLLPAACAVEMIHTYSLIHDDLPALDNDDLRRGQPTCHRVFGEAIAILAGDGLLTKAFQVLADYPQENGLESRKLQTLLTLARACGPEGMIAGQVADLEWEGREDITEEMVYTIHKGKTASLIAASVKAGALMAGASREVLRGLEIYGENLGMAFQIIDDILDVTQTNEVLGKTAGKDAAHHKATYPSVCGLEASRIKAEQYVRASISALIPFGEKGIRLRQLAEFVAERNK